MHKSDMSEHTISRIANIGLQVHVTCHTNEIYSPRTMTARALLAAMDFSKNEVVVHRFRFISDTIQMNRKNNS